jgi:glycerol uptake facilitator-like aquaporin
VHDEALLVWCRRTITSGRDSPDRDPGQTRLAASAGPALIVGHQALSQVWRFIVAPLVGGALAALVYRYLVPATPADAPTAVAEGEVERTTATP